VGVLPQSLSTRTVLTFILGTPNAIKILDTIGFDPQRAGSCPINGWRMCDDKGTVASDADFDFVGHLGALPRSQMRAAFRDELLRLATAPSEELGIAGQPATMVWQKGAVGLDPEEGIVTLQDGTTVKGDLVVGELGRREGTGRRQEWHRHHWRRMDPR
jgi:salicylate hydroxylase